MGARLVFFTSECPTLISPIHLWEDFVKDLKNFVGIFVKWYFMREKQNFPFWAVWCPLANMPQNYNGTQQSHN
jgi:hypothetical protein